MQNNIQKVPLKKIGTLVKREVALLPFEKYRTIGCKLYGLGVYERGTKTGGEIATSKMFLVRSNDFLINRIWAQKGSVGIVPPELDGSVVTNDFPVIQLNLEKIFPKYLAFFVKTQQFWEECKKHSHGTSGRERLSPKDLTDIEIPLPPLKEQQRIVVTLELLMTKIEGARRERTQTEKEIENIKRSVLRFFFSPFEYELRRLEDACEAIIDNLHSTPRYDGNEFPCVRSQDVNDGCINFLSALKTGVDEFNERIRRAEPRTGDIVYVREGDVGRCAVINGTQRFSLGQRVMMFRPDQSKVDPKFLFYQLISPPFHEDQVLCSMTGTTSRHVNIKELRDMKIIIPPLLDQRRIVAHLDRLLVKVDEVRRLQAETEREMEALVPAVLAKAIGGGGMILPRWIKTF